MRAKLPKDLTKLQCKMARAGLDWTVRHLEELTHVHRTSITRFETGHTKPNATTRLALRRAFEEAGVEFFEDCGVIIRQGEQPEEDSDDE